MDKIQNIPKELISNTINFDYKTPMSKVSPYINKYKAIIINKDKNYFGIVDSRTIYRGKQGFKIPGNEAIEKFTIRAPRITNSTSIDDLVYYFYKSGAKALPYSSGNKVSGILKRETLLKVLLSLNVVEDIKVNEAMTTPILAIDGNSSIARAKATMRDRKINRLVVLQNEKLAGLITNYDIAKYNTSANERLPNMKDVSYTPSNIGINSVMEKNVRSIEYNRSLSDAVRDMVENKISSLIVVKNSRPIGIVTVSDVFESIVARKKVEEKRVFMSGFDENTYQYEDTAREELKSFVDGIEKLSGIDVDYVTFKVRRNKTKFYDMQVRLSLGRHGIISMHTSEYLFEDALKGLLIKLKHKVIKEKESILTHRKVSASREEE